MHEQGDEQGLLCYMRKKEEIEDAWILCSMRQKKKKNRRKRKKRKKEKKKKKK